MKRNWAVHAVDPKRSTSICDVNDVVEYPLCGTPDKGYGSLFATSPRSVTCEKCKKLLREKPAIKASSER